MPCFEDHRWRACVACLSSFYGAAWLAALWCPLAAALAGLVALRVVAVRRRRAA